jgi:hypothetical protein
MLFGESVIGIAPRVLVASPGPWLQPRVGALQIMRPRYEPVKVARTYICE